jgi:hypothetical protein
MSGLGRYGVVIRYRAAEGPKKIVKAATVS